MRLCLDVLLDNAVKFSRPAAHHRGGQRARGGGVELLVRDHGAGVPEGELPMCSKKRRGTTPRMPDRAGAVHGARVSSARRELHGTICPKAAQISGFGCRLLPDRKSLASAEGSSDNSLTRLLRPLVQGTGTVARLLTNKEWRINDANTHRRRQSGLRRRNGGVPR
jgi:hypothetical protein